jgi:hypothetical protein
MSKEDREIDIEVGIAETLAEQTWNVLPDKNKFIASVRIAIKRDFDTAIRDLFITAFGIGFSTREDMGDDYADIKQDVLNEIDNPMIDIEKMRRDLQNEKDGIYKTKGNTDES